MQTTQVSSTFSKVVLGVCVCARVRGHAMPGGQRTAVELVLSLYLYLGSGTQTQAIELLRQVFLPNDELPCWPPSQMLLFVDLVLHFITSYFITSDFVV